VVGDPARGWLVVWIQAGVVLRFRAALAVCPGSWITPDLQNALDVLQLAQTRGAQSLTVQQLRLLDVPLTDLDVRISRRLGRLPLRVDAILGQDFLSRFESIVLEAGPSIASTRLTFVLP
jgi:hypothetical protein